MRNKDKCTGCMACVNICPVDAIKNEVDSLGFSYPVIDKEKCFNCGKCRNICSNENSKASQIAECAYYYAGQAKEEKIRLESQSGGVFTLLAERVLVQNGAVYGAGIKNAYSVEHMRIDAVEDLYRLKKSKYVQSELGLIYRDVAEQLLKDRKVLFSGLPCQISGLNSFLLLHGICTDNLFTVDLVCHGAPSQKIWVEYCKYIEKKYNKNIKSVDFRDKKHYGWKSNKETFYFSDGTYKSFENFARLFYERLIFKSACYTCKFSSLDRCSDITIGDFWGDGNEKIRELKGDNKGTSCIIVNSYKGVRLLKDIEESIVLIESNANEILQPQLNEPPERNPKQEEFICYYKKYGFEKTLKKYGPHPIYDFCVKEYMFFKHILKK